MLARRVDLLKRGEQLPVVRQRVVITAEQPQVLSVAVGADEVLLVQFAVVFAQLGQGGLVELERIRHAAVVPHRHRDLGGERERLPVVGRAAVPPDLQRALAQVQALVVAAAQVQPHDLMDDQRPEGRVIGLKGPRGHQMVDRALVNRVVLLLLGAAGIGRGEQCVHGGAEHARRLLTVDFDPALGDGLHDLVQLHHVSHAVHADEGESGELTLRPLERAPVAQHPAQARGQARTR